MPRIEFRVTEGEYAVGQAVCEGIMPPLHAVFLTEATRAIYKMMNNNYDVHVEEMIITPRNAIFRYFDGERTFNVVVYRMSCGD